MASGHFVRRIWLPWLRLQLRSFKVFTDMASKTHGLIGVLFKYRNTDMTSQTTASLLQRPPNHQRLINRYDFRVSAPFFSRQTGGVNWFERWVWLLPIEMGLR